MRRFVKKLKLKNASVTLFCKFNCGLCKESFDRVLLPDPFEAVLCLAEFSIRRVLCLGEKLGMIVKDDCSSWCNRVGDFFWMPVWERRKEILYGEGSACKVSWRDPALECETNGNNCYGG